MWVEYIGEDDLWWWRLSTVVYCTVLVLDNIDCWKASVAAEGLVCGVSVVAGKLSGNLIT